MGLKGMALIPIQIGIEMQETQRIVRQQMTTGTIMRQEMEEQQTGDRKGMVLMPIQIDIEIHATRTTRMKHMRSGEFTTKCHPKRRF